MQNKNSLVLFVIIALSILLKATTSLAANYYVTENGDGLKNGSNWSNAMAGLKSDGMDGSASWAVSTNLERGSTYYIAGGNFPHYAFDTVESNQQWIRVVKATQSNSGNVVGWNGLTEAQRTGQTFFGYLYFRTDYYELDGQIRDESNWSDSSKYGFRLQMSAPNWNSYAINMDSNNFGPGADHIRLKYFDIGGPAGSTWTGSPTASGVGSGFYIKPASDTSPGHDDIYIGYSNIHNILLIIKSIGTTNLVYEFNFSGPGFSKEGIAHQHGAGWIIRNNKFVDINAHPNVEAGTSVIGVFGISPGTADADNWQIYGNVFMETGNYTTTHCCGTILGGERDHYVDKTYQPVNNWKVYNNVFYNMHGSDVGINLHGLNNVAYNNLFYQLNASSGFGCRTDLCNKDKLDCAPNTYLPTCDATWCIGGGCSGIPGTKYIGTDNPFINPAAFDFRLKSTMTGISPIDKGKTLNSAEGFDLVDPLSVTRGQGSAWDIGAYELGGSSTTTPSSPSGLRIN